jgi:ABC-type glycerol-3-phosphate transport system substrate-binding protein
LALVVIAGLSVAGVSSSARAAPSIKIKVAIMSSHGMSDSAEDTAKEFNKRYGPQITAEVTAIGFDVLLDKMLTDFSTHSRSFDIYSVGYHWIGTVARYLADLDEIRKKYPDIVDKDYDFNDFPKILWQTYATWGGKNIGLPFVDGALTLFYRSDLFENPKNKAQFKKTYGYDLRMPKDGDIFRLTPKNLRDYAEFFTTGVKWRDGEQFGISVPGKVGDPLLSTFCAFLGYYRRSPEGIKALGEVDADWGDYFTQDHRPAFDPRITDIGMKALTDYLALGKFSPNPANLDWVTSSEPFRSGITTMFAGWGGYWPSITAEDAPVHGKVAVANLPMPHLGGWNVAINKDSEHLREAYMYIQLLTNKKNTMHLYEAFTETPTRLSTMTDKALKAKNVDLWVMAPALAFTSTRPKLSVLPKFEHAMSGTLGPIWAGKDPKEALIATADEWMRILKGAGIK